MNIVDLALRRFGYVTGEDAAKAACEAAAKAVAESKAAPPELIAAAMTALSTGVAPEKSWQQLTDSYRSWVYTAIDKIAKTIATRHMHMFVVRELRTGRKVEDPSSVLAKIAEVETAEERAYVLKGMGYERQEIFEHPFLALLRRPNGIMSRMVLWYETVLRMELGGLCAWYMAPNTLRLPAEIWPLPLTKTAEIKPRVTGFLQIEGWHYQDGNVNKVLPTEDVTPLKYPNPSSPFLGFSPLMAQTYPYDIDLFLSQQQRSLFQNKAIPGIHFHTDQPLGTDQFKEVLEQVRESWGKATNSGRPMVTHSGLKADKAGWSNRDSMVEEVSKWAREKLITSYDLSEAKLGLEVPSNRANMEVLDETFEKECILPKCMLIEEQLNTFILPRYDRGLICEFERKDIGDREFDLKEEETLLKNRVVVINDVRAKRGLPPAPWGDKPWFSFSDTQNPDAPEPAPAPKKTLDPEEKASNAAATRWRRFVAWQTPWENLVAAQVRGHFKAQGDEVIARLKKLGPRVEAQYAGWSRKAVERHIAEKGIGDDININKKAEAARLRLLVKPPVSAMMAEAATRVLEELGLDFRFNANDPKVKKWLGSRMEMFSEEVSGTTFDDIKAVLRVGFSDGKPLSVIADTLREKFDSFEAYRAPLIARTETIAASNKTDLMAINQAGIQDKVKKTWLSARDSHVRPSHVAAEKQYAAGIPIDALFKVGGDEMEAPGNGSDPAESINCRCAMGYVKA